VAKPFLRTRAGAITATPDRQILEAGFLFTVRWYRLAEDLKPDGFHLRVLLLPTLLGSKIKEESN
jgi:hypothetical protein